MPKQEILRGCGISPEDICAYLRFEADGNRVEQERILRKQRRILLDAVHREEKRIAQIDLLLYEIKQNSGV